MPTEADVTYGFNREQALELVNGLGQRDFEMKLYEPEPGAGGGSATVFVAELTAAWSTNSAAVEIYSMDGNTLTFVENSTVFDPLAAFDVLSTGDRLYVTKQGNKYYAANNAPCPTGGGAPEPL